MKKEADVSIIVASQDPLPRVVTQGGSGTTIKRPAA